MMPDLCALLVPLSPENPAGDNLEYEPLFDEIRLARESDPDDLPQDEWMVSEPRKADWQRVLTLSEKALQEKTKDLQLACWLVEALSHQQGLAGLSTGIEFLDEFITRFWFLCWPSLEEEGSEMRRGKLLRLDRDLSQQLLRQPLLNQPNTSLLFWRQVLAFEHKMSTRPHEQETPSCQEGDFTMESFQQQAARFSASEIDRQALRVDALVIAFAQLEANYRSVCQDSEGKLFSQTHQMLVDLADHLQRLNQYAIPVATDSVATNMPTENEAPAVTAAPKAMSRELAVSNMLAIASYFRQSEPSSPVPFLMERAARWASMTLPEWLEEMLSDSNSIDEIKNVLTGKSR